MPLTVKAKRTPLVVKAEQQPLVIKPEPIDDRLQNRKRSGTFSVLQGIASKKIKAEPENPPLTQADAELPPFMSTEAIRSELLELQTDVNHLQPMLDRARRKEEKKKTATQLKREMKITSQLIALYQRRKELTEMLPAVSALTHPLPGPSYQNGATDGFAQPRQPPTLVHPSIPTVTAASGSNLFANPLKYEPMDWESDGGDAIPPPTSDMDHIPPVGGDNDQMLVDGTNFGVEFYHYNIAKADE